MTDLSCALPAAASHASASSMGRADESRSGARRELGAHLALIAACAGLVFFTNLGGAPLWDEDEPKNAACTREMLARGDWVTPMFNGELRTAKPVLMYWFMMSAYALFGDGEFGARFWSAVFGIGTCLLTYAAGRILYSPRVGLWSGLILPACLMFAVSSRACTPDAPLVFFSTLGLVLFLAATASASRRSDGAASSSAVRPAPLVLPRLGLWWVGIYAAMSAAVLAKGPVGIALPSIILALFVVLATRPVRASGAVGGQDWAPREGTSGRIALMQHGLEWLRGARSVWNPVRCAREVWRLHPWLAALVLAAVAVPWYVWVGLRTEGAWLQGFLGEHNVGRFLRPMEGHRGPVWYYVPAVLAGAFPWSVFLPYSVWALIRRLRASEAESAEHRADLFVACWAGTYLLFFSLARTKLPSYVLPAYPPLALVIGAMVAPWADRAAQAVHDGLAPAWRQALAPPPPRLAAAAMAIALAVGVAVAIGVPIAAAQFVPAAWWLGWPGAVLALGVWWSWRLLGSASPAIPLRTFAATSAAFAVCLLGLAPSALRSFPPSPTLAGAVSEGAPLAAYGWYQPSLTYYHGAPVERLKRPEQAAAFFSTAERGYLVLRADLLDQVRPHLPADVREVERTANFLKPGELVLLGRERPTEISPRGAAAPTVLSE